MKFTIHFLVQSGSEYMTSQIPEAVAWLGKNTPLDIRHSISYVDVTIKHKLFIDKGNGQYWFGTKGVKEQLRAHTPVNGHHAVVFLYDRSKSGIHFPPAFTVASWSFWKPIYQHTEYCEVAMDIAAHDKGWTWKLIAHELVHAFVKKANRLGRNVKDEMDVTVVNGKQIDYYKNGTPEASDGNFARTLRNLEPHWDAVAMFPKPKRWQYFTESEVEGLVPEFVDWLDGVRHSCGFPFIITSGFRTPEQNKRIGGAPNSAHLRGLAVDLAITDSDKRYTLLKEALSANVPRIGIGETFVHLDIDTSLPQGVLWHYYD